MKSEVVLDDPLEQARRLRRQLEEDIMPDNSRRWRRLRLYLGGWTIVGLVFASALIVPSLAEGTKIPWTQVASELLRWYLWAALAPISWWISQRYPIERGSVVKGLLINGIVGIAVTMMFAVIDRFKREVIPAIFTGHFTLDSLMDWKMLVFWEVEYNLQIYLGIVAAIHAFRYYDKFRDRELKTTRLEAQLAHARLDVLKMQLHPHFLFNTLNAISALMHRDVEAADRMIALLSDLLRLSLDKDNRHQVSLKSELEFLERYLAIEKIRFRDRLSVEMDVESSCLSAQVPRLILQPLVENSIRHGIAMRSAAGHVAIRARRKGNRLDLSVADDGPGLIESRKPLREGVGLANTRARLEQMYSHDHRFDLRKADTGGLLVAMEIPFEEEPRIMADGLD